MSLEQTRRLREKQQPKTPQEAVCASEKAEALPAASEFVQGSSLLI
ncbi:hypothetical protein SAMN05444126_11113 [Salisediminibacterium halotolerans]|uniref:Uncharacterized protein n=1 Tax=Salisediminibacterium halotolerans TaxID=517425 RepID=A0A1H9TTN0_9BACI|nr:hypothetical protein SAMN05444126_11113 [Salisediminibacterium haloalkalitolerans]